MKKEEKLENLTKIVELKKELLGLRLKLSMGETIQNNKAKSIKKEIARIYTKLNSNK
jgi:ribosomal protein L29